MPSLVSPLEAIEPYQAALFGHKGAGLGALVRAGFPVPPGFCISNEAYVAHAKKALGERWWMARDGVDPVEAMSRQELDLVLIEQVVSAYTALGSGAPLVAVRSSSNLEDEGRFSGAGVQESLIGVAGVDELLETIRSVWASAWSFKSQAYLESHQPSTLGPILIGVVVQLVVKAESAGVMFTTNPVDGNSSEILVNATFGLGEPVCSGHLSPDTFIVDKETLEVQRRSIVSKPFMISFESERRVVVDLELDRAMSTSLNDDQLYQVTAIGREIERALGGPKDIEWAVEGDRVSILQARPIVEPLKDATGSVESPPGRPDDIWTNANVGEALPGVATPLTWSLASRYSERGFRRAFAALGCEVPEGSVLVARFRGRIYLNLTQFTEIASQLPLLSPQTLAELGGARWPEGLVPPKSSPGVLDGARFIRRLPIAIGRLVQQNIAVERQVEGFESRVADAWRRLEGRDLRRVKTSQLRDELIATDTLLEATGDAMLTCGSNSLGSFLLVRYLLGRWLSDGTGGIEHELISGASDLESAKPGIALWHMAEGLKTDSEAASILLETDLDQLEVRSFKKGSRMRRDLESFQAAHGYRAVREAELMTPRWSEEPILIFAALREYLRSGGPPPARALEARLRARREAAERVDRELGRGFRRNLVRRLVEVARRYSRLRERLRARVTQVLGLYRLIALEVGRRLGHSDVAFFLTIDEIHQLLRDSRSKWDNPNDSGPFPIRYAGLGPLIARRRQEYEGLLNLPEPPSTFEGTPALVVERESSSVSGFELIGVAASPGRATGEARILRDVREAGYLKAGDILVVRTADVGWSPLFLIAGALVTELGGVLSHAAVVAREYGVPAVVGVQGALKRIENGQKLVVDGDNGCVVVHAKY